MQVDLFTFEGRNMYSCLDQNSVVAYHLWQVHILCIGTVLDYLYLPYWIFRGGGLGGMEYPLVVRGVGENILKSVVL